jgi:hypothetical protein
LCAAPLPVTLTTFTGRLDKNCIATLAWRTATEVNSQAYEVLASADGQHFELAGTVPSRNQPSGAAYTYRLGPLAGTRYFRLRLVDADGTATYSPVVALVPTCAAPRLVLAPNPAHDQLTVSGLPDGHNQLLLYNAAGRLLRQLSASQATTVAIGDLPAGIYFVQARTEAGQSAGSAKVVKQ